MYTTCMFCGFPPFNIFALIYQKKKKRTNRFWPDLCYNEVVRGEFVLTLFSIARSKDA